VVYYINMENKTTLFNQIAQLEPVAFGGFSELYVLGGNAVKLIEDQDYLGTLEESYKQNLAAEAGLAPRIHAVAKQDEKVVVVMDMIDHDEWFHPDAGQDTTPTLLGELDEVEMFVGLKLYCRLLKAGIVHADFHTGNWFMNDKGEGLAIDFGIASELHEAPEKHIKRAVQFMLPALLELGYVDVADQLIEAWGCGWEVAREELAEIAAQVV